MGIRVAVAAFVVLSAAVGCDGGDPSPTTVPTVTSPSVSPSSSPSATPTPTVSPPTLPALARQDSPAGAQSFARFYIQVLDYSYQSGDTSLLRQLARCNGCDAVADGIDKWTTAGGRYEGGRLKVVGSDIVKHVTGSAGLVALTYSRSTRILISSDGQREQVSSAPALQVVLTERRTSSGWLITNIQTVK